MPIRFDLSKYRNRIFVETGTYRGDSVRAALEAGFERVYSIEIDDQLYHDARLRFAEEIADSRVILLHGDSGRCLPEIIGAVQEKCTFWLDAHSQDYNFANETNSYDNCPLYRELDEIAKSVRRDHTILIDDLRLVRDKRAWRGHDVTLEGVLARLEAINKRYVFEYENGYIENDVLAAFIR